MLGGLVDLCESPDSTLRARGGDSTCSPRSSLPSDREQELIELYFRAKTQVEEKLFKKALTRTIMDRFAEGDYDSLAFKPSEFYRKESEKFRFITISLPSGDIPDTVRRVNKVLYSRKWLPANGTKWVYEQRGDTPEDCGDGLHIHMIAHTTKVPCEIIRELAKTLSIAPNFIHVTTETDLPRFTNYILGDKEPSKRTKQYYDRYMRIKHNIESFYQK